MGVSACGRMGVGGGGFVWLKKSGFGRQRWRLEVGRGGAVGLILEEGTKARRHVGTKGGDDVLRGLRGRGRGWVEGRNGWRVTSGQSRSARPSRVADSCACALGEGLR